MTNSTQTSAKTKEIFARRESEARSYCRSFDTVFSKAKGSVLTDTDGKEYIDFLAGCSSLNYGHNDPDMQAALIEHIQGDGITHALDMFTDAKAKFLTAFEEIILKPRGMDHKVMMTGPTGANPVEAAIKLARKVTGRHTIISFTNGFHGMTMGALSLTGNAGKRGGAGAPLDGVARMPYEGAFGPDVDTLAQIEMLLSNPSSGIDAPAAFIVEPVQGEGGLNAASKEWMQGIARLARDHGALLIVDDIQAGCGRTGTFFSFEEFGIDPDLITQAKSFSGMGLPFAALLIKPQHDIWKPAEHNGTFRGNTHAFVTARVALEKFWKNDAFEKDVQAKGDRLAEGLERIAATIPGATTKGRGMFRGIDVGSGDLAAAICGTCFEEGLVIETSGAHDEVVKVLAPLNIPDALLDRGLDILADAVKRHAPTITTMAAE
ncbi:diaminobutyrate--2-oxoglutarate transaminase [Brevirhabdus pacifica]|uniref:Diaminobutyrate--2-oxoglutarate transaminase n=1 Tax=Brevirhabdus pacifica TaxID=1267768 RepID=A0A1U7DFG9_9RHOB|nr:diaminobutyrate--2-oxoglutarate transaminase [Brevirhabdus pacifica]APX88744.1 diaminobutyrate--2-oxoglutarate transaminase [Brevirhabdus pacifica]OWU80001.1 diaminobutyrate--2-oxoglutarate aminotransferase [Loktanella sp. 22II-4b]PJJ86735.1 diaminobutyrate aminotransferase [Brevirhabdus pacifica]